MTPIQKLKEAWEADANSDHLLECLRAAMPDIIAAYNSGSVPPVDAIVPICQKYLNENKELKNQFMLALTTIFYASTAKENMWYDCQLMAWAFATPEQLAGALIKTMGKWEED